jgi:hypothetical protein
MLESKPADLYSVFKSLGIVSEVQDAIGVDQIINNAILKRNEELYLAEINKDTQYLIVDLVNLIADKEIFGQVIDEFQRISSNGINEEDQPTISKIFAEIDDVFSPDLSETTDISDLIVELMFQETFTSLMDEIEEVLLNNTIYSVHHENGYDVDKPAERLSARNMSVDLYNNVTYMLGNNSDTAILMNAFDQIFQQKYTS